MRSRSFSESELCAVLPTVLPNIQPHHLRSECTTQEPKPSPKALRHPPPQKVKTQLAQDGPDLPARWPPSDHGFPRPWVRVCRFRRNGMGGMATSRYEEPEHESSKTSLQVLSQAGRSTSKSHCNHIMNHNHGSWCSGCCPKLFRG